MWRCSLPIEIPKHAHRREDGTYPTFWDYGSVYHHWASHGESPQWLTSDQVCVHADWFSGVHLIAVAQMILHDQTDVTLAGPAVRLEGRNATCLIAGGGVLEDLNGMWELPRDSRENRLDLVSGVVKDARQVQYLMFAGLSHLTPQKAPHPLTAHAAEGWIRFVDGMSSLLHRVGLDDLQREEWFSVPGWRSMRYVWRHERDFAALAELLVNLKHVMHSSYRTTLRREVRHLVNEIVDGLETAVHGYRIGKVPIFGRQCLEERSAQWIRSRTP